MTPVSASSESMTPSRQRRAPTKVRIGVVGGGFGSHFQWHLDPDCTVVAVCDKREDRLEILKRTYRSDNLYKDYAEFLKHPDMNAVAIFTPAPFHAEMAMQAFAAGKHVVSAVPAGMSVEELEMLLDGVKRSGLRYMMAETSRYWAETMACIEMSKQGRFGTIFYSESEYHHSGLAPYAYGPSFDCQSCDFVHSIDKVRDATGYVDVSKLVKTWSYGYPPMLYPTHSTGVIIPVTGERLTEVTAYGWGDGSAMLQQNTYQNNPFFHTVALFKTSGGHCSRVSIGWHIAAEGTERAVFYGDRMSYIMERPEGSPNTIVEQKDAPPFGIYTGAVESRVVAQDNFFERLPESLRIKSGHGNSHTFITHEFVRAIMEDRHPEVNIWEAIAYNLPGLVAHQSALEGGRTLKIRDYGRAPA
jgi:predicted dehydrogenase